MSGGEQKRFCGQCSKNVYNISRMTKDEAESLLRGGNACIRLYRRKDGTIITEDCPVALRKLRDGARYCYALVATIFSFVFSFCTSSTSAQNEVGFRESFADGLADRYEMPLLEPFGSISMGQQRVSFLNCTLPSVETLVSGDFALMRDDIFQKDGKTFMIVESVPGTKSIKRLAAGLLADQIGPYFCSEIAHQRALWYADAGRDLTAEKYHKLCLKLLSFRRSTMVKDPELLERDSDFRKTMSASYAHFLRQHGRDRESQELATIYGDKPLGPHPLPGTELKLGNKFSSRAIGTSRDKSGFPTWGKHEMEIFESQKNCFKN